ncbi:hypothetical protein [Cronobacter malonaticus]|uniref:hypothetical protein n=1 Tax=Cronobacter malonaticus TaxID=413503 RepID=UPI00192A57BF|nr:hypothetical protein [Cronobacter malonaticus]
MNYEKTKELVKSGHQLVVLLGTQNGMHEAASLVQRMAGQLDVLIAVLREKTKQCDQLAAENAALKSEASYFSYGSEHNFEWHKTAEEAVEAAEAAIDDYRGDACDGWSEEVTSICWGLIMQTATKVGERPRTEDDSCDPAIDTICDYALLPNIETPSTDAFLREVKAQGAENAAAYIKLSIQQIPEDLRVAYHDAIELCSGAADKLRKGGAA